MGCLDDVEVLELVSGVMPAAELSRADAHLDGCDACRLLVASVVRARRGPEAVELAPGDRVGRFVVEERRASGAMGVVFTAKDPELGRRVAIKVLRPELEGGEARGRLLREAQAMAKVADPNVVAVFEVGTVGDQIFVAMELVEGSTLRAWLSEGERSTAAILEVFQQAGRGLAAAHRAGLVHRDFKPDNVLVARDGRVRVTDFGLASAPLALAAEPLGDEASGDLVHTRTGTLLGTPAYMAPEQLAGEGADARSDQFAFAVALFEALHGERPFAGATVAELGASIRAKQLRAPGARRLPAATNLALQKALEPEPASRHEEMGAFLAALQPAPERRYGRWLAAGLSVVLLAAGAGVVFNLASARVPPPVCRMSSDLEKLWNQEQKIAIGNSFAAAAPSFGRAAAEEVAGNIDRWQSRFETATSQVCNAPEDPKLSPVVTAQAACLELGLVEVRTVIAGLSTLDRDGVARATELVSSSLPDIAACTAPGVQRDSEPSTSQARQESFLSREAMARARAAVTVSDFAKAAREAEQAVRSARASAHLPTVGAALLTSAEVARAGGSADTALEFAREALFALEEGRDDRGAARAWIAMMAIEGSRARYDKANDWAGFATAALARAGNPASLQADLAETLGAIQLARGEIPLASGSLERALALASELGEDESARGARIRTNQGNLERARGNLSAAFDLHWRALRIDKQRLGDDHPELGRHFHNIAGIEKAQGKLEMAERSYERALSLKRSGFGNDHPEVALTLNSLGIVAQERGQTENARAFYAEAIRIFTLQQHEQRAVVERNLGTLPAPTASAALSAPEGRPSTAPSARPAATGRPPATAAPTTGQPSYMPGPAFP